MEKEKTKNKTNKININALVLSGGSIKGIAHVGAMKYLEEKNIINDIITFAGTSVGGIISALYIVGYTPDELMEFINLLDLNALKKINIDNFFAEYGLDDGKRLIFILEKMIEAKGFSKVITLEQLYNKTKKKIILSSVCINDKKLVYLSHETMPDLPLITALRMTSSIPLFFCPVHYNNKVYIDGGLMNNYPISLFDDSLENTIGIYLSDEEESTNINNLETYFISVVQSLAKGFANALIAKYEHRTVRLSLRNAGLLDFSITAEKKN
jgi:NTE family protein